MLRIKGLRAVREIEPDEAQQALADEKAQFFEMDLKGAQGADRVTAIVSTDRRRVVLVVDYHPTATGPHVPAQGRQALKGNRAATLEDFVQTLESFGLRAVADTWSVKPDGEDKSAGGGE